MKTSEMLLRQLHPPRRKNATIALCSVLLILSCELCGAGKAKHPWTLETSIAMRYFETPWRFGTPSPVSVVDEEPALPVLPAPDGTKFVIVSQRGDLSTGENISEMHIYDTLAVTHAVQNGNATPAPIQTLVRRSAVGSAIFKVEWAPDGRFLKFIGEDEDSQSELKVKLNHYALNVGTGEVTLLWEQRDKRGTAMLCWNGNRAVCVDYSDQPVSIETKIRYPGEALTEQVVARAIEQGRGSNPTTAKIYGITENSYRELGLFTWIGGKRRLVSALVGTATSMLKGSLDPTGRWAIVTAPPATLSRRLNATASAPQSLLLEMDSGRLRSLCVSLSGSATELSRNRSRSPDVVWAPDGQTALLSNATIPSGETEADGAAYLLSYKPANGAWSRIVAMQKNGLELSTVNWAEDGRHILTEWKAGGGSEIRRVTYEKQGNVWRATGLVMAAATPALTWQHPEIQSERFLEEIAKTKSAPGERIQPGASWLTHLPPQASQCSNGLSLTLEESPDEPQRLVATVGKNRLILSDPDPVLAAVEIAKSRQIEWKSTGGRVHRALLTMPARHTNRPVPLVIQLGYHSPQIFRPDGTEPGHAKQTLVARGIAVLEVTSRDVVLTDDLTAIVPESLQNIYSAIDALVGEHLVDSERLGITGFSFKGYLAVQALLRPRRYRFRAAVANDSSLRTLGEYFYSCLQDVSKGVDRDSIHSNAADMIRVHGGRPAEALKHWLTVAPDLAASRATGAFLDVQHTWRASVLVNYCMLAGAFSEAGRPYEGFCIPDGNHGLTRVHSRFASMAANVDWFDFWLNEHERTEPVASAGETEERLTEKYTRWRKMKADWERQQAWEAADHPAGSIPAKDFKMPEGTNRRDR